MQQPKPAEPETPGIPVLDSSGVAVTGDASITKRADSQTLKATQPTVATHQSASHQGTESSEAGPSEVAEQVAVNVGAVALENDSSTDHDSAIGDLGSYATSTYTVGSAIRKPIVENGRTYHMYKDGTYFLPNDEKELNRLDIQHKMWLITLDEKLHLAPLGDTLHNVLDLATGTGIWSIEFADAPPTANVLGTDLSLIQPNYVPPNCRFEIDDVEDDWVFPQKFDYIHGRALATCFKDGAKVINKSYAALEPGGYLELQDFRMLTAEDWPPLKGTMSESLANHITEGMKKIGRVSRGENVPSYKRWMVEAGFEDVTELTFVWPCNQLWPDTRKEKLLGAWWEAQIDAGVLESVTTRLFLSILGWSQEELTVFLAMVRKEHKDPKLRLHTPVHVVWGRKPLES